ncbi:basic blue protein-like [Macadamia integrifolia]|uniref:basic blue protein-like n=1 Tax=Macadamia integrifolia TaxID=60698 RepID=UPI001C533ADE|nr:basic blue protein-like [Macadamia integrifolia]
MGQERGSAMATKGIVLLVLLCFTIQWEIAQAKSYMVGGVTGWTFGVQSWPKGKKFRVGDILVFKYLPTAHNVVKVNHYGYKTCSVPKGSFITRTGNDHIKLRKGNNFFLCNLPGHCINAMKIVVYAT